MRALTGASGFVGRAVRAAFGAEPVLTVGRSSVGAGAPRVEVDLAEAGAASRLVEALRPHHPTCLVHLAGVTPWSKDPSFAHDLRMAEAVAAVCNALAIERLIYMSGWVVYDANAPAPYAETTATAPATAYGASKAAVEQALGAALDKTKLVAVRASSIYGPGQTSVGLIPNLVGCALRGEPLALNARTTRRDYIYVDDAARAVRRLCDVALAAPVSVVNLGGGRSVAVSEVAEAVRDASAAETGATVEIRYAAQLTEALPPDNQLDITRANQWGVLGEQRTFVDGIRAYVAWRRREGLL